jgi:hypothetical protein
MSDPENWPGMREVPPPAEPRRAKSNGAATDEGPHGGQRDERNPPPIDEATEGPKPNFRTLAEFCAEFRPISYAVAGLMREGSLYTFTGRTGEGKTAFLVILALAVATGRGELIGREVKKGRVAFATAENPDDLRMRFMVACYMFDIDPAVIDRDIVVSDNRVAPEDIVAWTRETGESFTLIIVDTWQAYFDGKDPNNNAEAVAFTRRFRPLTQLPGAPVVIIAAHPPKQAPNDSLLPYGGGGTLNEVDGNFRMHRDAAGLYQFHWLGKIRGAPFDPLHYRIGRFDSPDVVTVDDTRLQIPVMSPIDEKSVEERAAAIAGRDLRLLKALADNPHATIRALAAEAKEPSTSTVVRTLERLAKEKPALVRHQFGKWAVTKAGKRALDDTSEGGTTCHLFQAEQDAEQNS